MPWEPHNQSTNNYVFVDSSLFFKNLICKANLAETRIYQITSKGISDYNDRCIEAHLLTHMLADDKIGRTTAEFGNVICNILKVVCVMNVHKEKKILAIYVLTKLQPIRGHPFLVSPCVIPCYKIISIKNSLCTQDDNFSGFNRFLEKVIKNFN